MAFLGAQREAINGLRALVDAHGLDFPIPAKTLSLDTQTRLLWPERAEM